MSQIAQHIGALLKNGVHPPRVALRLLIDHGLDRVPFPGSGATLGRWQVLATVAQFDLSLAKLYEGHTDALAILHELAPNESPAKGSAWGVWAAEAPAGRTLLQPLRPGHVLLTGAKCWCSGAMHGDQALLTAWGPNAGGPQLVAVDLAQSGVRMDDTGWKAVGMAASQSVNVAFDGALGRLVGSEGAYLSRPGFWQGGAGVAACWYGGAVGIAQALRQALLGGAITPASGYKLASMGKVALSLGETAAVLREGATWIDAHPLQDAAHVALATRLSAERCAKRVIDEVGKALGATPFCLNATFAQAVADLPVFIRQSHGERDFAALGEHVLHTEAAPWTL